MIYMIEALGGWCLTVKTCFVLFVLISSCTPNAPFPPPFSSNPQRKQQVKAAVEALPRLKALWFNGNAVAKALAADSTLQSRLEIWNRRLTPSYTAWALRYLASGGEEEEGDDEVCVCVCACVFMCP
jgi:hypothetical protein